MMIEIEIRLYGEGLDVAYECKFRKQLSQFIADYGMCGGQARYREGEKFFPNEREWRYVR